MPSFDVVSEISKPELKNAVDNASRELSTRFDFRGVDASFSLNDDGILMKAEGDFQLKQMMNILIEKLGKRKIDPHAVDFTGTPEQSGKTWSQLIKLREGIDREMGKKIVKAIKDSKLKVQAQIDGDAVRVTGKKKDDLQAVIALLRGQDFGQLSRRMILCCLTGFSSGLPLYVLLNLVQAWLTAENVNIKTLGLFALVMFPYTWKFLWAPFFDSVSPVKGMGRRRGWLLVTQTALFLLITMMGLIDPKSVMSLAGFQVSGVTLAAGMCFLVSMASASQDIALDALRREILKDNELGLGNSLFVNLYRLSQLVPGSLAFILADHIPWSMVYLVTGLFMIPGLLATLFVVKEPPIPTVKRTFREAVSLPLKEFVSRKGVRHALLVLLFIFCYKLGDSMATSLLTRFYLDKGFSRTAIGILSKSVSLPMSVIGALLGGIWMLKIGINRALWLFGLFQFLTILIFILLDMYPTKTVLSLVIGAEAFGVGLGTCAFTSYLARETNPAYTAFQFALFTSLAAVPRTFFNAVCGYLQAFLGWSGFYYVCAIIAVPGMLLLLKVAPWRGGSDLESGKQNF